MSASPHGPDARAAVGRLVAEATNKGGLIWIRPEGSPLSSPAWHAWIEADAYVVVGGAEQPLPELVHAQHAEVTVPSKDTGGRVITWLAAVSRVVPESEEWHRVLPVLTAKRLNALDRHELPQRWARESTVLRLAPTGEVSQLPGAMPIDGGAAAPRSTPATTSGRLPFVLGRSRRRPKHRPRPELSDPGRLPAPSGSDS